MKINQNVLAYKFLTKSGRGPVSNLPYESYPEKDAQGDWQPSEWLKYVPRLDVCVSGYHASPPSYLFNHISETLYVVELSSPLNLSDGSIYVAHSMRFLRQIEGYNVKAAYNYLVYCLNLCYQHYGRKNSLVEDYIANYQIFADGGDNRRILNELANRLYPTSLLLENIGNDKLRALYNAIQYSCSPNWYESVGYVHYSTLYYVGNGDRHELAIKNTNYFLDLIGESQNHLPDVDFYLGNGDPNENLDE